MRDNWNRMADLTKKLGPGEHEREREIRMRSKLQNMFAGADNVKELRNCIQLTARTLNVEVKITDESLEEVLRT